MLALWEKAAALMDEQCRGAIRNMVCLQGGDAFVLAPDGKLRRAQSGWQPTFLGPMVFFE